MVLIGFSDTISLTQSIGIVGTMVLTLYFSETNTIFFDVFWPSTVEMLLHDSVQKAAARRSSS